MNMKHMVDGYMVSNPGAARPKIAQGKSEGSQGDLKWDSKKVFFFPILCAFETIFHVVIVSQLMILFVKQVGVSLT